MKVFLALLPVIILLILLAIFLWRCCCYKRRIQVRETQTSNETLQSGIAKLHLSHNNSAAYSCNSSTKSQHQHTQIAPDKKRPNYYVIRRGALAEPFFNWADHPWLVTEAVENGWSRFTFTTLTPSLPRSKSVWELCAVCNYGREGEVEMNWEVCSGSLDCLQKIRFYSRSKKLVRSSSNNPLEFSYVRMDLPLPGPPLGNSSFPQEAYFEITVLSGEDAEVVDSKSISSGQGEHLKLITEAAMKTQSDSLVHAISVEEEDGVNKKKIEESRADGDALISLGLSCGGFPSFKLPGTYPGSIGFNSNGSVYLEGIKLVFEAKEADWGGTDKVIGCGFDPGRKRVFFTVDSKIVHVIHCKPEEFGSPLYPILASNTDATVLVNLGQTTFKYAPANLHRTPNPCFFRPLPDGASPPLRMLYEEDSKELFSMGRLDSHWLGSRTKNSTGSVENGVVNSDVGAESEIDELFEIVLDDQGKWR